MKRPTERNPDRVLKVPKCDSCLVYAENNLKKYIEIYEDCPRSEINIKNSRKAGGVFYYIVDVCGEEKRYEQYSGTINDITDKSSESRYGMRFNRRNYTQSAKDLLGDDTLLKLARVLVERVKDKASID